MKLPKMLSSRQRVNRQIVNFGGINYGESFSDGDFANTENVCSELYPCITPRSGRVELSKLDEPNGIFAGDDLFYIDGDVVYRNREEFGILDTSEGKGIKRKLLVINTKLVVFPDKVYFNLDDKDNFEMMKTEPSDWETNYEAYYEKKDEEFTPVVGSAAPTWVADRYYKYIKIHSLGAKVLLGGGTFTITANSIILGDSSAYELYPAESFITTLGKYYAYGNDAVSFSAKTGSVTFGNSMAATTKSVNDESFVGDIVQVREHKVNAGNFIVYEGSTNSNYAMIDGVGIVTNMIEVHKSSGVSGDYDRLRFEVRVFRVRKRDAYSFTEGFADCFKPGDAVKITGCGRYEVNNMTLIARDVVGDTIAFDDNVFVPADLEPGCVTLEREVPDFDVVCEHNNRIWGAGEDKIYASSLGDPTNYNVYDGLASDSWTVAVASPGKFTGCIGYSGNVIFFKEDMMYKVMGDYPSSFGMYPYNVAGVALGSEQSIVNINERLFYHSADGIYTYSGSLPQLVSYNFGARRFDSASAFAFGTKYYISMRGKDGFGLFVYDTLRDIWLREDSSEVIGFAERGNEKLMLCADGSLIQLDSGDEAVSWSVETCEFTEFIDNRKCYSRLLLRLDMESKSSVKVQIRRDRGRWETVYAENAENKMQNAKYPLNFSEGEYRNYYTVNVPLRPIRCDRFSIRISGVGKVVIRSLVREFEAGSTV